MKLNKKIKIKGCSCYGVNSIHPCFCSPFSNKTKIKPLKQADVIKSFACLDDDNSCDKQCDACKFVEKGLKQANVL